MTSAAQSKTRNPHQRRREQVYAVLSEAPAGATYSQLVAFVKERTGKGCSRKLISQWKRESGQADKSTDGRGQVHGQVEKSTDTSRQVHGQADGRDPISANTVDGCDPISANTVDGRDPISANTVDGCDPINPKSPNVVPFKRPLLPKRRQTVTNGRGSAPVPAPVTSYQLPIQNLKSKIQNQFPNPLKSP